MKTRIDTQTARNTFRKCVDFLRRTSKEKDGQLLATFRDGRLYAQSDFGFFEGCKWDGANEADGIWFNVLAASIATDSAKSNTTTLRYNDDTRLMEVSFDSYAAIKLPVWPCPHVELFSKVDNRKMVPLTAVRPTLPALAHCAARRTQTVLDLVFFSVDGDFASVSTDSKFVHLTNANFASGAVSIQASHFDANASGVSVALLGDKLCAILHFDGIGEVAYFAGYDADAVTAKRIIEQADESATKKFSCAVADLRDSLRFNNGEARGVAATLKIDGEVVTTKSDEAVNLNRSYRIAPNDVFEKEGSINVNRAQVASLLSCLPQDRLVDVSFGENIYFDSCGTRIALSRMAVQANMFNVEE